MTCFLGCPWSTLTLARENAKNNEPHAAAATSLSEVVGLSSQSSADALFPESRPLNSPLGCNVPIAPPPNRADSREGVAKTYIDIDVGLKSET